MTTGVVDSLSITWTAPGGFAGGGFAGGSLVGLYQAPIQNAWNVVVQQIQPGGAMDWNKGTIFLYIPIPGVQAGDCLDVWAQAGIKGADVYTGRVTTGCGLGIASDAQWQANTAALIPASSVGEDWNSDVRPYVEYSMHQAFIAPVSGTIWAYFKAYAAVYAPAPAGYLKAMWPHGSILVKRYSHGS